jgi:hypothetical protein
MPRRMTAAWVAWLLTLPAVFVFAWVAVERCMATTLDDDCGVVYMLPVGWLLPWAIGVIVLGFGIVVFWRRPR